VWHWKERKPGEPIKLASVTGSDQYIANPVWHAGAEIDRTWIDDNKIARVEEILRQGREQGYESLSKRAYETLFAPNYPVVPVGSTKDIENRIKALNKAIDQLVRSKDSEGNKKFWCPSKNTPIILYCPLELEGVWEQALKQNSNKDYKGERLKYRVTLSSTEHLDATITSSYVFPAKKAHIFQDRMGMERDSSKNHMAFGYEHSFHMRNNLAVLDSDAGREITGVV